METCEPGLTHSGRDGIFFLAYCESRPRLAGQMGLRGEFLLKPVPVQSFPFDLGLISETAYTCRREAASVDFTLNRHTRHSPAEPFSNSPPFGKFVGDQPAPGPG